MTPAINPFEQAVQQLDQAAAIMNLDPNLLPAFTYEMKPPETPSEFSRHVPAEMPAAERVKSYAEVSLGLTAVAALEETTRCLRCDVRSVER